MNHAEVWMSEWQCLEMGQRRKEGNEQPLGSAQLTTHSMELSVHFTSCPHGYRKHRRAHAQTCDVCVQIYMTWHTQTSMQAPMVCAL